MPHLAVWLRGALATEPSALGQRDRPGRGAGGAAASGSSGEGGPGGGLCPPGGERGRLSLKRATQEPACLCFFPIYGRGAYGRCSARRQPPGTAASGAGDVRPEGRGAAPAHGGDNAGGGGPPPEPPLLGTPRLGTPGQVSPGRRRGDAPHGDPCPGDSPGDSGGTSPPRDPRAGECWGRRGAPSAQGPAQVSPVGRMGPQAGAHRAEGTEGSPGAAAAGGKALWGAGGRRR